MKRQWLADLLAGEGPSIQDVWAWYEFQQALVGEEKGRVLTALAHGSTNVADRYVGKTREEPEEDFGDHSGELALMTMLSLLAGTEAALRVDFIARVRKKAKDPVSRAFWRAYQRTGKRPERIRLEEDILDNRRKLAPAATIKKAIGEFKGALHLRHWLAHGRYWKPKLGRPEYDPITVFDICRVLLQAVGLMPLDPAST